MLSKVIHKLNKIVQIYPRRKAMQKEQLNEINN